MALYYLHCLFLNRRANQDLIMTIDLELVEALCGFQKTIETLDGRQLVITTIPGEVIKSGEVKCVRNEGMPISGDYTHRGKLIIQFNVSFPKEIAPELVAQLENCLPPR
jgi:DnaJ family protein A protein 1